jgi:hypothetical protein
MANFISRLQNVLQIDPYSVSQLDRKIQEGREVMLHAQ